MDDIRSRPQHPSTINVTNLEKQISELIVQQSKADMTFSRLTKEKIKIKESFSIEEASSTDCDIPYFQHILPLVENVYWLELKEKAMQRECQKELLSLEARHIGQKLLCDSVSSEECVLKRWFEELTTLKAEQPDLFKLSSKKDKASIHNINYEAKFTAHSYCEELLFTILCNTVHVRIKMTSSIPCSDKHEEMFFSKGLLNVFSDIFIPSLEQTVVHSLQENISVSKIISHVATFIVNDIAPFVIGLPLKRKKKKSVKCSSSDATVVTDEGKVSEC